MISRVIIMSCLISNQQLLSELNRYLQWEKESFCGWENIEIFIAETLSEAWLLARPKDKYKFEKNSFKQIVDNADGKWLEKQDENDTYKIILSTKYCQNIQYLTSILVHEMRHCLDYQNAVRSLSFQEYRPGNAYYNNWSEYRAVYSQTRYEYFYKCSADLNSHKKFNAMSEILGQKTADAISGLMRPNNEIKDYLYYLSQYIGVSRSIRNISLQENIGVNVFSLWNMTPQYIIEHFGYVFYIGNEWDKCEFCEIDATAVTPYYNELINRISNQFV